MHPVAETLSQTLSSDHRQLASENDPAVQLLAAGATDVTSCDGAKTGFDLAATVNAQNLLTSAKALRSSGFALECVLGIDRKTCLESVYLFRPCGRGPRIRLCAKVGYDEAMLPSLTPVYSGADWHEREIHDMFGIEFTGHPHLTQLLLPSDANFHPLRKDFRGAPTLVVEDDSTIPEFDRDTAIRMGKVSPERRDFFLNMGPQHPSTHGVLRILLHVEGEEVLSGRCHLGYSHRGTEKAAEIKQYVQFLPYTDRIDYLSPLNFNWGYAKLLERATGIESTPRAESIRIIMGELARAASHLVWLGTFLLDLGAVTPFLYCFEDREHLLTIFEAVTGQRMTTSYIVVGGVRNDVPADFPSRVSAALKLLRKRLPEYRTLIMENDIFVRRTDGVGKISAEQVRDVGVSGPCARGSGVAFDMRDSEPYCTSYEQAGFAPVTETAGDCMARSNVRLRELEQSLDIIESALGRMPEGETRSKIPRNLKVPEGDYYSATESPRGLLGWYLVADGSMNPYRLKIRVPSFSNLQVVEQLLPGHRVADVVAILGSMDVVIPEIDR